MRPTVVPPRPPLLPPGQTPSFSVVIPAYQVAHLIGEAVTSALSQTSTAHEIIVCDDGSTDALEAALQPYLDRIVLLRESHRGVAAARNTAVAAASGEFIAILDADDVYLPARLEALGELARARPDLDLLCTDAWMEVEGEDVGRFNRKNPFDVSDQRKAILDRCFISWPAIRRQRLLDSGGFDESLTVASDWECWMRLVLDGARAGLVDEPLMRYRPRSGSLTEDRTRSLNARVTILEKAALHPSLSGEELRFLRKSLAAKRRRVAAVEAGQALADRTEGWRTVARFGFGPGLDLRGRIDVGRVAAAHALGRVRTRASSGGGRSGRAAPP